MKFLARLLFVLALCSAIPASAQMTLLNAGSGALSGVGCTASVDFLARVAAQTANYTAAYRTFICGLVADGVFSKLSALYTFKAREEATAQTNLVSSSFAVTKSGAPTFTADVGYTGAAAAYLDTNLNNNTLPQNATSFGVAVSAIGATTATVPLVGTTNSGNNSYLSAIDVPGTLYWRVNQNTDDAPAPPGTRTGFYIASRNASGVANAANLYKDGALFRTNSSTSGAPVNATFKFLTDGYGTATTATITIGFVANATLTATDATNFNNRVTTYLAAVP